ncbi:cysteine peptidase family C39 domain-containing protein [Serratia quinivorans]|uniref:cysteine peptidase family C39 domain-containing protein n=1 Tax=Serratia quinivorans TaxID=137545 RepID=UPI0039827DE1
MPVSASQHRATTGTHQNKIFENNRRNNITHNPAINRDSQHDFPFALTHVGNSLDAMYRPTEQLTLRQSTVLLCLQLLSQIRPGDNPLYAVPGNTALDSGRNALPSVSQNTAYSENSGTGFSAMLSPVANVLYETGQFIARHDPLLFPAASASPVPQAETESTTVASVVRDLIGDSYIITGEQKKNELISSLVQYLVSDGQMTADEGKYVELWLRSEAAGMPMVAARLDNEEVDTSRTKRALAAENDPRTAEHIKEHCAFEEEVLDAQGENQGKVLIFQAQRAENPFRMIYDNNPNGRPSPAERGGADGLNISGDIITFGIKPLIGKLIANAKRREYYQNLGDEICAERFRRLFIAEAATSLDVDGLTFARRGNYGKVKPSELLHALPEHERAAFFTRNPRTGIRKEILLELKQGNGAINDNGRKVYLKPTERKNEFVTYYPDAVKPELLERRVIVDENNLSWRYADSFDPLGLNVEISEGKRQIRLHGENYELQKNTAGKYEIVVNKDSGIKEFIPVYMEPLSRTWHLSTHNEHSVFSNKQTDLIKEMKVNKEKGFYYIPRGNNNQNYYGNGNIYVQEKMGDSGHYPWGRYVEMNGEMVPVRNTKHQGQGVLYEVYDMKFPEKAGHPIEWDGNRWLFERKTSVHVSKDLENLISPEMVSEKINVGKLSAPDHQGLRHDVDGNKYINIKNEFYKVESMGDGYVLYLLDGKKLGLRLSYGKNKFESDYFAKSNSGEHSLKKNAPSHIERILKRKGAFKVKQNKSLNTLLSKDSISNNFKLGDLSPQNSLGIRRSSDGKMYIKAREGWVNIKKDSVGYYIHDKSEIIRVEFLKGQWKEAKKTQGFPEQFNYYSGEHVTATASCTDGSSITFDINPQETLTKNLLNHFDAIDDGIIFDTSKIKSNKPNLFSINKISINKSDSAKSVYYPNEKPGGFKYYKVLFDDVPVNFGKQDVVLIKPDNYETFSTYSQYPYDLHIMKQGNMDSCGYTCVAMVAKDLKSAKNIDESAINFYLKMKDESTGGTFSSTLSESMANYGIANNLIYTENPINYIQNKIQENRWSGIVNIDGHFCIITKADDNEFYLRDPYQGILSVERIGKLKKYKIGNDIIEI